MDLANEGTYCAGGCDHIGCKVVWMVETLCVEELYGHDVESKGEELPFVSTSYCRA